MGYTFYADTNTRSQNMKDNQELLLGQNVILYAIKQDREQEIESWEYKINKKEQGRTRHARFL